jgi:hypothetical protein
MFPFKTNSLLSKIKDYLGIQETAWKFYDSNKV